MRVAADADANVFCINNDKRKKKRWKTNQVSATNQMRLFMKREKKTKISLDRSQCEGNERDGERQGENDRLHETNEEDEKANKNRERKQILK